MSKKFLMIVTLAFIIMIFIGCSNQEMYSDKYEERFNVVGEYKNWKASLEYTLTKEKIMIDGDLKYIGDNPPEKAEYEFVYYKIVNDDIDKTKNQTLEESSIIKSSRELKDSKIKLTSLSGRQYELETYKKAIDNAYIEVKWKEQGNNKTEKINLLIKEDN